MNAGRASGIAGVFALICASAFADDGTTKPPSSPSAPKSGVVTGPEKALSDKAGRSKALLTKKDKQAEVDATTRIGSEAADRSWNRQSEPRGGKSWDEMTAAEQDAARRRWLLDSGDFGPPGVRAEDRAKMQVPPRKAGGEAPGGAGAPPAGGASK